MFWIPASAGMTKKSVLICVHLWFPSIFLFFFWLRLRRAVVKKNGVNLDKYKIRLSVNKVKHCIR